MSENEAWAAEERAAWDQYAAGALAGLAAKWETGHAVHVASNAGHLADAMADERRKRFPVSVVDFSANDGLYQHAREAIRKGSGILVPVTPEAIFKANSGGYAKPAEEAVEEEPAAPLSEEGEEENSGMTAGRLLQEHGVANAFCMAAAVRWFIAICRQEPLPKLTPEETYEVYKRNVQLQDAIRLTRSCRLDKLATGSVAAACCYVFQQLARKRGNEPRANQFIRDVGLGEGLSRSDVAYEVRDRLLELPRRGEFTRRAACSILIRGWSMAAGEGGDFAEFDYSGPLFLPRVFGLGDEFVAHAKRTLGIQAVEGLGLTAKIGEF